MTEQATTEAVAETQAVGEAQAPVTETPATGAETAVQTAEAKPPAGAPEKYEFTAPEGQEYTPKMLEAFENAARNIDLPQEGAQKLLDSLAPALHQHALEQIESVKNGWAESSKSDKEFGGDKLTESLALAKQARDQFGTPELTALLEETGLGNHPEIIRAFVKIGKAVSQDAVIGNGRSAAPPKSTASLLYPSMNK